MMRTTKKTLEIATSPHIASGASVDVIMRNVVYALLPVCAFSIYVFGLSALVTLTAATLSCLLTEHLLCRWRGEASTIGDWSVAITGILLGLTLPPGLPVWMVVIGGIAGVGVGKFLFGGLAYNAFNPALVGRAFLAAAFPVSLTTWYPPFGADRFTVLPSSTFTFPFATPVYDSLSGATPLAAMKFDGELTATADLVMGMTSGSTGETGGLLILAGGIYLVARKMMNWRIPVAIFATVIALSGGLYLLDPGTYPTDMVASPMTSLGCVIYGVLIGALVVVIRLWGAMPEGVMYAILFANAVSPHIDNLCQPRVYGTTRRSAS
jgi:electron transport complex protein RnfD